jgi:signal transduction histidine kinase
MFGERIALRLELSEQVRPVQVDPMQLEQAILNVVLNARDAIAQRGEIRIATDRVEIGGAGASSLPPGRYSVVRVSDDGSGMDDETQARIFEPYFTTKKEKGGTGLGLPLVRLFVEQAGGDVRVRSRLGAGTTIELLLPEAPDEA